MEGIWCRKFIKGYLKVINPDDFTEILEDSYVRSQVAIPVFTTALGDILVWEDGYITILKFRKSEVDIVCKGGKHFFNNLNENYFLTKKLEWNPYPEAVIQYGTPAYDECFGYVPLLGLGGTESVEKLKKVKLIEHIQIITHFMGMLEY
ncbi:hypothetical protein J2Z32_002077 [Paenibacillus turicensis]|uniref:T6SS immunity protein Tdi1 C-terminal domain-containing protein n=1 Tax=Paenibacillus turicensis TaxID=160487 RepID=A0ABS4FS82_9BACL|nr:hypothetical protein [Paenibacillus turicensis]